MSRTVAVVAVAGLLAGLGAAVWWSLREPETDPSRAATGPGLPAVPDDPAEPALPPGAVAGTAPPKSLPPLEREAPMRAPEDTVPGRGLRFTFDGWPEIEKVDWDHVGYAVRKARRNARDLMRRFRAGEPILPDDPRIMEADSSIVKTLGEFGRRVLMTDRDPEGPRTTLFAHPAFEANAIAATLASHGLAMTPAQEEALRPVWTAHAERFATARGATDAGWSLPGLVAATRSRAEVQTRLDEVLNEKQRKALWPDDIRGRVGLDGFSPGAIWHGRIMVLPMPAPDDLVEVVTSTICTLGGKMTEIEHRTVRDGVRAWVQAKPDWWRKGVRGDLEMHGYLATDQVLACIDGWAELIASVAPECAGQLLHQPGPMPFRRLVIAHVHPM